MFYNSINLASSKCVQSLAVFARATVLLRQQRPNQLAQQNAKIPLSTVAVYLHTVTSPKQRTWWLSNVLLLVVSVKVKQSRYCSHPVTWTFFSRRKRERSCCGCYRSSGPRTNTGGCMCWYSGHWLPEVPSLLRQHQYSDPQGLQEILWPLRSRCASQTSYNYTKTCNDDHNSCPNNDKSSHY